MGIKLGKNIELTRQGLQVINESKPQSEILRQKIVERQLYRFSADVGKWRQALNAAESVHTPQRSELIRLFNEVTLDAHLSALMQSRISQILAHKFNVVDQSGEVSDRSEILQKEWFKKIIKYFAESIFYGFSLIELDCLEDLEFKEVCLLPRENVEPNKKLFKKEYYLLDGYPFLKEPFSNWTFYVERDDNLGLLNKAAPLTIWKKNALGSWSDYADIFGVPPRIGKTNVRDKDLRDNMEAMLENMGRLSFGVFDNEDNIELVQTSGSDAFNVFMRLGEFCNAELSKLVLGQTMTTDDGSSRSQSETHQKTLENVVRADLSWIEDLINSQFIPFLRDVHNFPFEQGDRFVYDHTESLSLTDQMDMTKSLLPFKNVPSDWINQRFGIPVTDKQEDQGSANAENFFFKSIKDCYLKESSHKCAGSVQMAIEPDSPLSAGDEERLYQAIYDGLISVNTLPEQLYLGTAEQLEKAAADGFGGGLKDFKPSTKEYKTLVSLNQDIYKFAANKTFQNIAEMQSLLRDKDGVLKTFQQFKKEAGEIFDLYNKTYLRTEFNTAFANSQSAEKWLTLQANKDVKPFVVYRTQGDNRVREDHSALDGKIYSLDDPALGAINPQNDWNCRCFLESTRTAPRNETAQEVKNNINLINPLFAFNAGRDGILFPPRHPYYKVPKRYKDKQKRNFDLEIPAVNG